MPIALVVVALIGGCKFRFDERTDARTSDASDAMITIDAPPNHDEDGDGTPDIADTCPHIAGPLTDGDGDGVGDLCDPEPMNNRQRLVLFDPFVNASGWTIVTGDWMPQGDALRVDTDAVYGELKRPLAFQAGVIEFGTDVVARTPNATQLQVTFAPIVALTMPYNYVEAFEFNPSPGYASFSEFDGSIFRPVAQVPMTTGVHPGPLTLRLKIIPPANYEIYVGWPGEPYTPGGTAGMAFPATAELHFGAQGVVVDVRYAVVIATN